MVPITTNKKAIKACTKLLTIFKDVHGDKYDYSKALYITGHTKVTIICPIHGEFHQEPNAHRSGRGCRLCGITYKDEKRTSNKSKFIEKAVKMHGDCYLYHNTVYTKIRNNMTITCKTHGDFILRGDHFLNGAGCPQCAEKHGFNKNVPAILYYLSINGGQAYKIGITNRNVNMRFSLAELKTIEVISTWYYDVGSDAYAEEQRILKEFSALKYTGPDLLLSGNTELFYSDVLNLHKKDNNGFTTISYTATTNDGMG